MLVEPAEISGWRRRVLVWRARENILGGYGVDLWMTGGGKMGRRRGEGGEKKLRGVNVESRSCGGVMLM